MTAAATLFALHFLHLRADFPNRSPWPDWAKFTDEGWYGSAAIRHYQLGHWNVPGDFNPAAALPVWPLLEALLFRFTGVSLLAARALAVAVFGTTLVHCYLLLRTSAANEDRANAVAPAIAVLLLAASPFYFAFSRLAILEPLMVLLALKSLMCAQRAGAASVTAWTDTDCLAPAPNRGRPLAAALAWSSALGVVFAAMVLTKTTALFLAPAMAWMLWAGCAYRLGLFLRTAACAALSALLTWSSYLIFFVRPHYLADYHYLFVANEYTGATFATLWPVISDAFGDGRYLGTIFFWLAVAAVVIVLAGFASRRSAPDGLTVSLLLWVVCYSIFLIWHDNLQPRYFYSLGVPLAMLIAVAFDGIIGAAAQPQTLSRRSSICRTIARLTALAVVVAMAIIVVRGALQEATYVTHPEHTFLTAIHAIRDTIGQQRANERSAGSPVHPETVLSISGADISFITGLPSICDDFGTMTLPDRIATYKPGWYVAWNDVEDDKMEAIAPAYRLVRVGQWPAFDDPDRNLLILYRLDPLHQTTSTPARRRRAINIPRRLRKSPAAPQQR